MIPPLSIELFVIAVACGVGCATAVYMAVRRNAKFIEYAFVVREYQEAGNDNMEQQLSFDDAVAQRDEVLEDMADRHSGWLALAASEMARLEPGVTGIGEDFRRILLERGVPPPKHPNAVGAFISTMVRRGYLRPTGEYRAMRDPKSNGRKSPVYTRVNPDAKAA
jgi:hypothetical protein